MVPLAITSNEAAAYEGWALSGDEDEDSGSGDGNDENEDDEDEEGD